MKSILDFLLISFLLSSYCSTVNSKDRLGTSIGDKCDNKCDGMNIICNPTTRKCQCQKDHPIVVHRQKYGSNKTSTFCLQPGKLGAECLHEEVCKWFDVNSDCIQMHHTAICDCKMEYHKILNKEGRYICVEETQLLNSDLATLIGVGVGMTLFCGLTCLVLRIFARARFGPRFRGHHYANAHLPPPITLTDPEGGGLNNSRHSSQRSSTGGSRRQSMLAPPGIGSRRASNASIRSAGSSRSNSFKNHPKNHSNHHGPHGHSPTEGSPRTKNDHHHHHHQHQNKEQENLKCPDNPPPPPPPTDNND